MRGGDGIQGLERGKVKRLKFTEHGSHRLQAPLMYIMKVLLEKVGRVRGGQGEG